MDERRVPTISDVAERAAVSRQTVSRVLNNNSYVSDSTRQRVLLAIRDLEYQPNPAAQELGRIGSAGRGRADGREGSNGDDVKARDS